MPPPGKIQIAVDPLSTCDLVAGHGGAGRQGVGGVGDVWGGGGGREGRTARVVLGQHPGLTLISCLICPSAAEEVPGRSRYSTARRHGHGAVWLVPTVASPTCSCRSWSEMAWFSRNFSSNVLLRVSSSVHFLARASSFLHPGALPLPVSLPPLLVAAREPGVYFLRPRQQVYLGGLPRAQLAMALPPSPRYRPARPYSTCETTPPAAVSNMKRFLLDESPISESTEKVKTLPVGPKRVHVLRNARACFLRS